jgi:hypothetical protein
MLDPGAQAWEPTRRRRLAVTVLVERPEAVPGRIALKAVRVAGVTSAAGSADTAPARDARISGGLARSPFASRTRPLMRDRCPRARGVRLASGPPSFVVKIGDTPKSYAGNVPGASQEARRVKIMNASWIAGADGDDGDFELMIVTSDDRHHVVATSPAAMTALVALAL